MDASDDQVWPDPPCCGSLSLNAAWQGFLDATDRPRRVRGFERARDAAGLPADLVLHDLRHAAVSRLIHAGLDPVTVATVVGHEDATTTLRVYAAEWNAVETDEAVRKALAGVGDL